MTVLQNSFTSRTWVRVRIGEELYTTVLGMKEVWLYDNWQELAANQERAREHMSVGEPNRSESESLVITCKSKKGLMMEF